MTFGGIYTEKKIKHYKVEFGKKVEYYDAYGIDNLRKRLISDYKMRSKKVGMGIYILHGKFSPKYGMGYEESWMGLMVSDGKGTILWDNHRKVSPGTGKLMG